MCVSDVSFKVGDTVLPAHKALLESRSDVVATMWNSKFAEGCVPSFFFCPACLRGALF